MKESSPFYCSFCGKEVTATGVKSQGGTWHLAGGGPIHCCHGCAVNVLPLLIADSVRVTSNGYVDGGQALEKASGAFWKGMTARLSRKEIA